MGDWPDQGYLPDNADGRLPDPKDPAGSDICLGYFDVLVDNRLSSSDTRLRVCDIEDGSKARERVARTIIVDQNGRGAGGIPLCRATREQHHRRSPFRFRESGAREGSRQSDSNWSSGRKWVGAIGG